MVNTMGKGRERSPMQIFFPTVEQRRKIRIPIIPEFTAFVSGHGKTKTYLHRFKLTDNLMCPCNGTSNPCMQNTGTPKKLLDTTYNYQRRDLAPHKQRTGCQIFRRLLTICQIYGFQQTVID